MLIDLSENRCSELRLFIEELCCTLCRFQHMDEDRLAPGDICINQEVYLGSPGAFADIRVKVPGAAPYFVEVKFGYPARKIINHLRRKYGQPAPGLEQAAKLVLVADTQQYPDWPQIQAEIEDDIQSGLRLEVWNEARLLQLVHERFRVDIKSLTEESIIHLRSAVDQLRGRHAFEEDWANDPVQSSLLWHFDFWRLRQLRQAGRTKLNTILPPGMYRGCVALLADLCSFSSYVRDTPDDEVVRQCLTSFYSKARYEIIHTGGMLYQVVGDQAVGLYGLPERSPGYLEDALTCAKALLTIGNSVSNEWQRHLDRIQNTQGVHIGMALGDIQIVSLQPFARAQIGAVSDAINLAARLLARAGPGEIVVSNTLFQGLDEKSQGEFQEIEPLEARNLGIIRALKWALA
jgi:class 3 adenylate cyclase